MTGHTGSITSVAFGPNGALLASAVPIGPYGCGPYAGTRAHRCRRCSEKLR
jgi:hypothetical protein